MIVQINPWLASVLTFRWPLFASCWERQSYSSDARPSSDRCTLTDVSQRQKQERWDAAASDSAMKERINQKRFRSDTLQVGVSLRIKRACYETGDIAVSDELCVRMEWHLLCKMKSYPGLFRGRRTRSWQTDVCCLHVELWVKLSASQENMDADNWEGVNTSLGVFEYLLSSHEGEAEEVVCSRRSACPLHPDLNQKK